ncbi:hypothetical protein ACTL6U_21420 [Rhodovibrionaceae bacterium A322]
MTSQSPDPKAEPSTALNSAFLRYALLMAGVYGLTYLALDFYFRTEEQYQSLRADLPWIILAVYLVSLVRRYFFGRKLAQKSKD